MHSSLICSPKTEHSLGYILFEYPKIEPIIREGAGAHEFLDYIKKNIPMLHATLPVRARLYALAFQIYYKEKDQWLPVVGTGLFTSFHATLPFLQSGNRVLIEFRNPRLSPNKQ